MRLDKYLKVSRIIKRRTVANDACDNALVTVNDRPAKASYDVKEGDVITIRTTNSPKFAAILEANGSKPVPKWLESDKENMTGKVITLASREDIDLPIEEHLIIEHYSK